MALKYALSFMIALAAFVAAPAADAQRVEGIAAVVNDEPITTLDVRDRMRLIIFSAGVQPDEQALERIQDQAIRGLVDETLQLQQAREFEVEVTDEEVEASIADIAARNGATVEEIEQDLTANGISIETLRQQIRAETAWQILVNGRYRSRVRISDQQIETALERIAQNASEPQFRLGEILIEITGARGEEEAQALLQTIFEQFNQGAPFPVVAQQYSDAPSAANGGDAGWVAESQLRPQIAQAVQNMEPGSLTRPIRVPSGYLITALIDRREGSATEQLTLQQITLPPSQVTDEKRRRLSRALDRIESCEAVSGAVNGVEGAIVTDLGTIGSNALIPRIRDALTTLEPVDATDLLDTAAGVQAFVLCDRSIGGAGVPSREEIEDQLINQQLSLLSRRWLRDIRREATVDIR